MLFVKWLLMTRVRLQNWKQEGFIIAKKYYLLVETWEHNNICHEIVLDTGSFLFFFWELQVQLQFIHIHQALNLPDSIITEFSFLMQLYK